MLNPASRIIRFLDGHRAVADHLGIHISRVYRMTYPRGPRRGSDGVIHHKYQVPLMELALKQGKYLAPEEFFKNVGQEDTEAKSASKEAA